MRMSWGVWKRALGFAGTAGAELALAALLAVGVGGMQPAAAGSEAAVEVAMASVEPTEPVARPVQPVMEKARPFVLARVDLSDQTMTVYVNERLSHTFPVSTGRGGYGTPTGRWHAEWLSRYHRSRKYDNAPMPWSVFFYKGYAVHGTTEISRLGRPASHGCVRLHPDDAKIFYRLVKESGTDNALISVVR